MTADKRIERIEHLLESLLAGRAFDSKVPLSLRDAALACNVELRWLRERVSRREIAAYRNGDDAPWRVFPADIRVFLMAQSNQAPARRVRVLKRAA